MRKVAVVADSTCCLPRETVDKYDISIVPLEIIYDGKSYRDGIDITPNEVYKIMRRKEDLPTTSTASAGDFLTAYRQLSQKAESVLCITLTSLQSKTFEAALAAKEIAKEELPETTVEVLDSRSVAAALGFIVREAARVAGQGAGLSDTIEAARKMIGKVNFLAMLDTLYYLARLGRIAGAAAWAGSLLDMKPI
jgi:DegV family protein with EDD domain